MHHIKANNNIALAVGRVLSCAAEAPVSRKKI